MQFSSEQLGDNAAEVGKPHGQANTLTDTLYRILRGPARARVCICHLLGIDININT
jgi:hypothetical protein